MTGYTFTLIVGNGGTDKEYISNLESVAKDNNINLKLLSLLDDAEKFQEMKSSQALLFMSKFEGFGYPPVEALYLGTPVVAFDLPVLREVNGDKINYVEEDNFSSIVSEILKTENFKDGERDNLTNAVEDVALFEAYITRLEQKLSLLFDGKK